MADTVYIVEEVFEVESHDDFHFDYDGEVKEIIGSMFFTSADDAWSFLKSLRWQHLVGWYGSYTTNEERREMYYDGKALHVRELRKR